MNDMRLIEQLRWWAVECDRTNFGCQARRLLLEAAEALEQSATIDAVPVVLCKDCKLWHEETGFCEKHSFFIDSDGVCCSPAESPNWTMTDPNDFCSYGERKDGEG